MSLLTLRLTEKLEQGLRREADHSKQSRSVLIRQALSEFLSHRSQQRELTIFKNAAKIIADKPADDDWEDWETLSSQALLAADGGDDA